MGKMFGPCVVTMLFITSEEHYNYTLYIVVHVIRVRLIPEVYPISPVIFLQLNGRPVLMS